MISPSHGGLSSLHHRISVFSVLSLTAVEILITLLIYMYVLSRLSHKH